MPMWTLNVPLPPLPQSCLLWPPDPGPQGHKGEAAGFSAPKGLIFAWQKMGRSWPCFLSICFGGGLLLFIWSQLLFGELRFCIQKSNLCNTLLIYCWLPRSELWEQVLNWGSGRWCLGFRRRFSPAVFVKCTQGPRTAFASGSFPVMTNGSVVQIPSASVSLRELVKNGLYAHQWISGGGVWIVSFKCWISIAMVYTTVLTEAFGCNDEWFIVHVLCW